jgi:predicted DNA-binding antitoxin AbrB/MazE fold protein
MSKTIEATYDGEVLRLSESLDIQPETKVWVTIQKVAPGNQASVLRAAQSARIEGPEDWSENLDTYLHEHKTTN